MTTLETDTRVETSTASVNGGSKELKVLLSNEYDSMGCFSPGAAPLQSGLPVIENDSGGYVFHVSSVSPLGQVTITFDTKQLSEQAKVRKVNRSIRRAR